MESQLTHKPCPGGEFSLPISSTCYYFCGPQVRSIIEMQFTSWEVWCSSQKTCFQSGSVTWIQQASTQSTKGKEALTVMATQGQVRSSEGVSPEMCRTCLLGPLSSYCQAMFRIRGLFLWWGNVSHYRTTELCITMSRLQKEFWSEDLEASEASQDTWGFQGSIHGHLVLQSYKAWFTHVPAYILAGALSQYWTVQKKMSFPSNFTSTKWFRKTDGPWGFTKMGEGNVAALWRTNGKWSREDFNGTWVGTS